MRTAIIDPIGLDNLHLVERPAPQPGPGEILVRLRAASLNYRDLIAAGGGYGSMQKQGDLIPLSDGAGEVVELGPGVSRWRIGDRVISCFCPDWQAGPPLPGCFDHDLGARCDGVAAELRTFREDAVVEIPESLSFHDAATLPCAAATAWHALIELGEIGPGQTVLTQGTGGVALFAVQIARLAGAEVFALSSSDLKLDRLRALGAAHVINYRADPDWGKTIVKLTGGRGVDHVVETGGGDTFRQSLRAVRIGGMISVIGVLGGARAELNIPVAIMQNVRLQGISPGSRAMLRELVAAVVQHRLAPVIDRVFPLAELRAALEHLRARRHIGKICIDI
ncbi:MAG: NAD(P)-dependent alcohol dehydrogenase [Gammaproteobacteria bacterium]|nr:NAD(P)-dependent alcohol dehydrogenase [Gammaproteobacteria bacterium]